MKSSALMLSLLIGISTSTGAGAQQVDLDQQRSNAYQTEPTILQYAFDRALADGLEYPQLLQAILLKESGAGKSPTFHRYKPGPGHCYGIAQMTIQTVKGVLKKHEELAEEFHLRGNFDKDIQAKLISDDKFSIAIASKYLVMLRDSGFKTRSAQAVAYNQGEGSARRTGESSKYSRSIIKIASRME